MKWRTARSPTFCGSRAWNRHRNAIAKTTWKEFLSRHRDLMVAADFFTIEAWTRKGLTRFLVLFFIDLSSRKVEIAGGAREANGLWMSQVARNLSDAAEGFSAGKRYLIQGCSHPSPRSLGWNAELLSSSGGLNAQV